MTKPELPFNDYYKKALLQYDFRFFLEKDIEENDYSDKDLQVLFGSYEKGMAKYRNERKKNPRQFDYWLEGKVRLMFMGSGFLPGFFGLDGWTRERKVFNFEPWGDDWAIFDLWQKHERRRHRWNKSWEAVTKIGAVLAIALTILKLFEIFMNK